jgi:flagellar biogenesis protein FliO
MGSTTAFAVQTLVTLLGIILLAVLLLYGAKRFGIGRATGPLSLLGRLPLEGRKSVYVVRVGSKGYALLASEAGLTKLDEVDVTALTEASAEGPPFTQLLANALSRRSGAHHDP